MLNPRSKTQTVLEITKKEPNIEKLRELVTNTNYQFDWDTLLSYVVSSHATIDILPELDEYLTQRKSNIIKLLLTYIKNANGKWEVKYVDSLIRKLQKVGIKWPELQIITRSTRAINKDTSNKELQELNRLVDNAEKLPTNSFEIAEELERLVIIAKNSKFTAKQCPKLLVLLDKNKKGLLKVMSTDLEKSPRYAEANVNRLSKFGVTWPELIEIKNRYYSAKLKEAWWDEESDDRHIDIFIGLMIDGDKWAYENLNNLITDKVSKIKLAAALKKNMKWVIRWLTRNLSVFSLKEVIENLATMPDVIPEIRAGIEPHKESIIRDLLTQTTRGLYNRIIDQITAYKMLGITWTELDIIERSIDYDIRKTAAINESTEHTRATALEYINKSVAELILNINKTLNDDNESLIGPHSFCTNAQYLMNRNLITRDDILQSLENARVHIIRYLLTKFKDGEYQNVYKWLGALQGTYGCEWPELNTIKRSFDAEVFKLTEVTDQEYETATKNLEALIMDMKESLAWVKERPHANVFPLNNLNRIAFMMRRGEIYRENILPELNSMKKEILTYMLQQIKSNERINYEIKNHCDELKSLGCDWPELDTVIRSYQADKRKLRESRDYREIYMDGLRKAIAKNDVDLVKDALVASQQMNIKLLASDIRFIKKHKDLIIKALSTLAEYLMFDWIFKIFTWMRINGFDGWNEELSIDYYKPQVLKGLLTYVKYSSFTQVMIDITYLQDAGVHWPELYTIKRSIDHERTKSSELQYE